MRKILAVALVLIVGTVMARADNSTAEKPDAPKPEAPKAEVAPAKTMNFHCYGGTAREAVEAYAKQLEYKCTLDPTFEADYACWIQLTNVTPEVVRGALEFALHSHVVVNDARKTVSAYGPMSNLSHGQPHIYDVSAQCGRYVEYVNKHAPKAKPLAPGDKPEKSACAASHVLETVGKVVFGGLRPGDSVVGDRLLMRNGDYDDSRVREFLGQLISDNPGVSLSAAKAMEAQALFDKPVEIKASETPVASMIMELARKTGANVVISPTIAPPLADAHVTITNEKDETARELLVRAYRDIELRARYRQGYLAVEEESLTGATESYFVFETSDLLDRLAKAYERQRTASGREGGYEGGLRDEGGVEVVVSALRDYFVGESLQAEVFSLGSCLIVMGDMQTRERAVEILKGLGWEDPATAGTSPDGR